MGTWGLGRESINRELVHSALSKVKQRSVLAPHTYLSVSLSEPTFCIRVSKQRSELDKESLEMDMDGKVVKSRFKTVCVFCGSSTGKRKCYRDAAVELAQELVHSKISHFFALLFGVLFFMLV